MNEYGQAHKELSPGERVQLWVWLGLSLLSAAGGIALFVILIVPDFNMYWLVVSPILLAFYEAPAVFFFWLYKKKKAEFLDLEESNEEEIQ